MNSTTTLPRPIRGLFALALAALALTQPAAQAAATTLLVDYRSSGDVAASAANFQANDANVDPSATVNNVTAAGTITSGAFTVNTGGSTGFWQGGGTYDNQPILEGYVYTDGTTRTVTITGLATVPSGQSFTLTLYGVGNNTGQSTTFTPTYGSSLGAKTTVYGTTPLVQWTFLSNGSTDTLTINWVKGGTANDGGFNGFSLTALPPVAVAADAGKSTVTASPTNVASDGVTTSTVTVTLKDSTSAAVAGRTVTLASSRSSTDTIAPVSGISNGSGVVVFTVKSATSGAAVFTATDTTDSVTVTQTAIVNFTASEVSAANSTVTAAPTTIAADGSATATITVTLKNAVSAPLSGKVVTLAKTSGPGSPAITTLAGTTDGAGVATFTVKSTTVGADVFTATGDSVALTQTATVTFTAGAVNAGTSTVVASPATVPADGSATSTVTVTLVDANGNPVAGKTVTLAHTSGPGTPVIATVSATTSASGVATFTVKSVTVGAEVFTATDTTDSVTLTPTATVTFTAATASITWGSAQDVTDLASDVLVNGTFVDAVTTYGSDVTLNGVTFKHYSSHTGSSPYSLTFGTSAISMTYPEYNLSFTNNPATTPYQQLRHTSMYAQSGAGTITLGNLTPGMQYQVQVWGPDWNGPISAVFEGQVTILGRNYSQSQRSQYAVGTFTATNSTQVIHFVAGAGGYCYAPTAVSLRDVTPVPAIAANSTVTASPTTVANDGVTTSTVTVTLKGVGNAAAWGKTVTLASNRGATDTIAPATGLSNDAGVVTFSVKSTTAGTAVFTATDVTDSNLVIAPSTASVTFSATVVSAATSTATASPATVTADGTSTSTVTVTLKNVGSVAIAGKTVTLVSSRGASDTISAASGISNASGVVTFTVKSTTLGAAVLTASVTGDSLVVAQTATVNFIAGTGNAANSTVTATPASVMADGATTATVTVTLKDATNNPVAGKTVTLASSRGASDTISPSSGTSAANGVVTFSVKSTTPGTPVFTATDTTDSVVVTPTATVTFTGSAAKDILTCSFGALGEARIAGTSITLTVAAGTVVTNLAPTFTISPFATISPASGSSRNFTAAQNYTVTAQNGGTQVYTVTVQSYQEWSHSGSLWLLTTPDGANLPAGATETNFPVLVRLNHDNFTFSQARTNGEDLRFATTAGMALPYQIEQWDAAAGTASVWVKIPTITGNARQEIRMYWGKADAAGESGAANVFSASNGFASVFHLAETVQDEVGSVTPVDSGTTVVTGLIGKCRNMVAGSGINCGENITNYPYASNPFTTECWFRADAIGGSPLYWGRYATRYNGNTGDGNEVGIYIGSPASLYWLSDGGGGASATTAPSVGQWYHVAAIYGNGISQIYVNGQLEDTHSGSSTAMSIVQNVQMKIGGWRGTFDYAGDIDEVRISQVARSANWMKLQYENQKAMQTLVGPLVQTGSTFAVSPTAVTMNEGTITTLTAQVGGAQKLYWIRKQNGVETVIATDQFTLDLAAGRVTGSQSYTLQLKAIYPTETRTVDIPVTITEDQPDPVFTLTAPATWDGRQTITVTPNISNLATLTTKGVTDFNYGWSLAGLAVIKQITPGTLTLVRCQGSGPLTVTLTLDNGGTPVTRSTTISVQEPATDAWVQRTPAADEKPVSHQFYARDDTGFGRIHYNGTLASPATKAFLKVYATPEGGTETLIDTLRQTLGTGGAYAFTKPIAAGLVTYRVEFGSTSAGGTDTLIDTVSDLVCGDAYMIDGQSNAVCDNNSDPDLTYYTSTWIRSFGNMTGGGNSFGNAVVSGMSGDAYRIGHWAMHLARSLMTQHQIPICMINGAVGGTLIFQHQPNPANHYDTSGGPYSNPYNIYGNLLTRITAAKLTHGIRGIFWHQGEADQASGAPTGDYNYKSYQQYFVDISANWKQDMPNIKHYYIYQIWPSAGNMLGETSDWLREVQRTLPHMYSNMSIMSTVGNPGTGLGSWHFQYEGYTQFSVLMRPLVERDNYGVVPPAADVTAPDLKQAYFTTNARNEIALVFGQTMAWNTTAKTNFYLDRGANQVTAGSASGNVVKLQLTGPSANQTIGYVLSSAWDGLTANLLYGANGVAALTFYGVPIAPPTPATLTAAAGAGQVALGWAASTGATGYQIKRAVTAGGPYTVIGSAAGTSFTDSTAANGTTYRYVVSATISVGDRVGESPDSTEASATPVAAAGTFESWIGGYFTTPGDPRRDPAADPDHDGLSNFHEYAFGLDPAVGASVNPCTPLHGTQFSYTRRANSGLSYTVEYSTDLTKWNPATASESVGAADSNGIQTVTVTVSNPALNGKLFVRVQAR